MKNFKEELIRRFGSEKVIEIAVQENEMPLILVDFGNQSQTRIVITNGLSDYQMTVPEKVKGREFNEIYFCLPSYWDINDLENPNMNWVFHWIQKLAKHVVAKNTWFGPGHTIPCGNPFQSLSETMKQNHFFLSDPILLKEELQPIELDNKIVYPLGIIPIFEDEMDYKQGKGTFKFLQKLTNHGISEKLDNYRGSILKSKWRFFSK